MWLSQNELQQFVTDEGLEVIIDFAGSGKTTADAIEAVAPGGKVSGRLIMNN